MAAVALLAIAACADSRRSQTRAMPDDGAQSESGPHVSTPREGSAGSAGSSAQPGQLPGKTPEPPDPAATPPPPAGPSPAEACELWQRALGERERQALQRLGLFGAAAVVEGVLGAAADLDGRSAVRVALKRVWFGWGFMQGSEVLVPMASETYAELGPGARVILGLGGPGQRPSTSTLMTDVPLWEPLWAVLRAEDAATVEPLVGYQPWKATAVAVARIVAQDEYRTRFQLLETLAGELPGEFAENWYAEWGLPYPAMSDDEYIVSVEYVDPSLAVTTIADIRPHDAQTRAEVGAALARWRDPGSPERSYFAQLERAAQDALTTRSAWLYHQAELVARVEVSGISHDCCTNAGGIYIANDVLGVFRGDAPDEPLITFGHGHYPEDACGDRFIYALRSVATLEPGGEGFACGEPIASGFGQTSSVHFHRLPDTAENVQAAMTWVQSAPPLYRLYAADQPADAALFAVPSGSALWSLPLAPEAALAAGEFVLFTVERVTAHADGHEVLLTTRFSDHAYDHLQPQQVKLLFSCGDPRLLEEGSSWLAPFASVDAGLWREGAAAEAVAAGDAFLVPGLLLPVRDELRQAATVIRTYPNPGVSVLVSP